MGKYINVGNDAFQIARGGRYVDKSGLIRVINDTLRSPRQFSCVTRCRRFGKSMAAGMLCAYYDHSCDSGHLFGDLAISRDPTYSRHLNRYPVIYLDISDFVTRYKDHTIVSRIDQSLRHDLAQAYPGVPMYDGDDLMDYLVRVVDATHAPFIFIIDEWDAICREFDDGTTMDQYVDWLRRLFKGGHSARVFAGAYMTGILPIKKYNTQSALNNFVEYSMVKPGSLAGYFGFTQSEVRALCTAHGMDIGELAKWYDGYQIGDTKSIFNPNSVMQAIYNHYCESYWGSTGAFSSVSHYISLNFDGLKDSIISMLAGSRVPVDATTFVNDMSTISSRDDVLTLLIHLGYLSYDRHDSTCYIPNSEVSGEMANAVRANNWDGVADALAQSRQLLLDTIDGNESAVALGIAKAHDDNTSILSYNNENSLACVLSIAYYYARNDYVMHRELPTGKGFADIALIPRGGSGMPAILLELKCDKDADTAISQIQRKQYPAKLMQHTHHLMLVGINYDRGTKRHTCKIIKTTTNCK